LNQSLSDSDSSESESDQDSIDSRDSVRMKNDIIYVMLCVPPLGGTSTPPWVPPALRSNFRGPPCKVGGAPRFPGMGKPRRRFPMGNHGMSRSAGGTHGGVEVPGHLGHRECQGHPEVLPEVSSSVGDTDYGKDRRVATLGFG
jgi:hypothetical protein